MAQQQQPYIYNRGQAIRQDMGKAAQNIEQGFQNLIDYKKQGYDFAKKQYEDIELLKKDLNKFDSEIITKRANDLLSRAKDVIKRNGKIDFTTTTQLRDEIRSISDAKRNSALKAKTLEEANSLLFKNAADMTDVFATSKQMNDILLDPNKLFSPKDISSEVMDIYKKGVNMSKRINDKIDAYLESRSGTGLDIYKTERGDTVQSQYKNIPGFIPIKGKYIPDEKPLSDGSKPDPYVTLINQILTPEEMQIFAEQAGPANMFARPIDLLKPLFESKLNSSISSKVGMFAEDVVRKQSLTTATLKRIDLNDKKFELQKEALAIRRSLANSKILLNSAQIKKLQDELRRRDSEGNRKGIYFDPESGEYVYDETKDATKSSADDFIKNLLGDTTPTPGGTASPKSGVTSPAKPEKKTIANF